MIQACERLTDKLVAALHYLLEQTVDQDLKYGIELSEGEEDARQQALAVIAEASGASPSHNVA